MNNGEKEEPILTADDISEILNQIEEVREEVKSEMVKEEFDEK